MQQYEPTVDSQMTKRLKKKENMHSIRVLFSNVLSNQRKKHHNVQSETRKLSQGADENSEKKTRKLTREKTSMIERKKKKNSS